MEKKNKKTPDSAASVRKNTKIMIISVSSFLALVILLFAVLGTVSLVRGSRAVISYEGVHIEWGVASYFAATYKSAFLADTKDSADTPEFWATKALGDKTYGELLEEKTLEYVKGIAVGAYLFDRYSSFDKALRDAVDKACAEKIEFLLGGDIDKFNNECSHMGFDYNDFKKATQLMYKAEMAKAAIYGEDGAALKLNSSLAECDKYYNDNFVHVKLLFIPTVKYFVKDEEGKLTFDGEGNYKTDYFTTAERTERTEDIEKIRELIEGYVNDGDVKMSPEYFDMMQEKYNVSHEYDDTGYYFAPKSAFKENFANDSSKYVGGDFGIAFNKCLNAAVETVFSMNIGEYREIEGDYGSLFIYKYDNEPLGYLSANASQFNDFFSDAADYLYSEYLRELAVGVSVREGFYDIPFTTIPYNYLYVASVG